MQRTSMLIAALLVAPLPLAACMWDRDTPGAESLEMPEVVQAITGRFERNPPLYYEMRLARVTAELADHPENFDLYDDAGVAADRLGRGAEAVEWMAKKRKQLDPLFPGLPAVKEATYRYHANLGTFLVHNWMRQGAERKRISEVEAARDEIAAAIKINPMAHFGRERYQLDALKWIIDPPKVSDEPPLPNLLGWAPASSQGASYDPKKADAAVEGLAGLIILGNAWESVDVFNALAVALQHDSLDYEPANLGAPGGRNALAYLAWLRCVELVDSGKGSILPGAPHGEDLKALITPPTHLKSDPKLLSEFTILRKEADDWQAKRLAFVTARLEQGHHPDDGKDFWTGYVETAPPTLSVPDSAAVLPKLPSPRTEISPAVVALVVLAISLLITAQFLQIRQSSRQRRAAISPAEGALPGSEA